MNIEQFKELDLICECQDCDEIWKAVEEVKQNVYKNYQSNTQTIIRSIEEFISI